MGLKINKLKIFWDIIEKEEFDEKEKMNKCGP
jgi:hypothetical protein